jgi:2-polyprenyl-3-methyl-5-hydroxy-6-metoxy-1,4-benzoquinol methylase
MSLSCHVCDEPYTKHTHYYECSSCTHRYQDPECNPTEFHRKQYRQITRRTRGEFDANHKVTSKFHDSRRWIVNKRYEIIQSLLDKNQLVLDIGAGAGTFANRIKNSVRDIHCIELDPDLIKECRRLGFKTFNSDFLDMPDERRYHIVCAWHVLEHVNDIYTFIEHAYRMCNQYLVFEIPSERKIPDKFNGHVHYFSRQSLTHFLNTLNIKYEILEGVQKPALLAICPKHY